MAIFLIDYTRNLNQAKNHNRDKYVLKPKGPQEG